LFSTCWVCVWSNAVEDKGYRVKIVASERKETQIKVEERTKTAVQAMKQMWGLECWMPKCRVDGVDGRGGQSTCAAIRRWARIWTGFYLCQGGSRRGDQSSCWRGKGDVDQSEVEPAGALSRRWLSALGGFRKGEGWDANEQKSEVAVCNNPNGKAQFITC
jgi:hypothetical protein